MKMIAIKKERLKKKGKVFMLLTPEMNVLLTQFIVEKTIVRDLRYRPMVLSMMCDLNETKLNLAFMYQLAKKYSNALKLQPLDPRLVLAYQESFEMKYQFSEDELKRCLVPEKFLEMLVVVHRTQLSTRFVLLLERMGSKVQQTFNQWLSDHMGDTLDLGDFLSWTEQVVSAYDLEEVQNSESVLEGIDSTSSFRSVDEIQKAFCSFYQSILQGLVDSDLKEARFENCHLTQEEVLAFSQTEPPLVVEWLIQLFLKTGRYVLNEEGVVVENQERLIQKRFKTVADWIRLNGSSLIKELEEKIVDLIDVMKKSEKGYDYYFQYLMNEVRQFNDEAMIETLSLVSQLRAKEVFYQTFNQNVE